MILKILTKVSWVFTKAASVVVVFVATVTLLNIILRTVISHPLPGSVEVIQLGMLLANALALSECGLLDRHIAVKQFVLWLPKRVGSTIQTLTSLISAATFGYIAYTYFLTIPQVIARGSITESLKVPTGFIYGVMAVCFTLGTLMFVYWTVKHFKQIIHPVIEEKKEGMDSINPEDMLV